MKRRRIILFGALLVLAAGVVALWPRGPKEPVYQGRKLSEWLSRLMTTIDPKTGLPEEHARTAIQGIGTNALPYLLYEFERPDPRWRLFIDRVARKLRSVETIPPLDRIAAAAYGIALLETNAASAIPILANHVENDPRRRDAAATALAHIGEPAIPCLVRITTLTNRDVAFYGVRSLEQMRQKTEAVVPHLLQIATNNGSWGERIWAMGGLYAVRSNSPAIIEVMIPLLSDRERRVQRRAANVLSSYGSQARSALPELVRMLNSTNETTMQAASNALYKIDPATLQK